MGVMMKKKKLAIILSTLAVIIIVTVLTIPGLIIGDSHGTMSVVRMYSENLDGPWDYMATENTQWVQEKTTYNGQTVIIIRPIGDFLWEEPEGTLVFVPKAPPEKETETIIIQRIPIFNGINHTVE
jgi:hypothetical protein